MPAALMAASTALLMAIGLLSRLMRDRRPARPVAPQVCKRLNHSPTPAQTARCPQTILLRSKSPRYCRKIGVRVSTFRVS